MGEGELHNDYDREFIEKLTPRLFPSSAVELCNDYSARASNPLYTFIILKKTKISNYVDVS